MTKRRAEQIIAWVKAFLLEMGEAGWWLADAADPLSHVKASEEGMTPEQFVFNVEESWLQFKHEQEKASVVWLVLDNFRPDTGQEMLADWTGGGAFEHALVAAAAVADIEVFGEEER